MSVTLEQHFLRQAHWSIEFSIYWRQWKWRYLQIQKQNALKFRWTHKLAGLTYSHVPALSVPATRTALVFSWRSCLLSPLYFLPYNYILYNAFVTAHFSKRRRRNNLLKRLLFCATVNMKMAFLWSREKKRITNLAMQFVMKMLRLVFYKWRKEEEK